MEEKIDSEENEIINTKDWVIDRARNFCERHSKWSGIVGAFLVGLFLNVLTDPNVQTWSVLLNRLFDVQTRPLNVLSWFAVFIILFLSVGRYSLQWWFLLKSLQRQLTTGFAALHLFGLIFEIAPCRPLIIGSGIGSARAARRKALNVRRHLARQFFRKNPHGRLPTNES